MISTWQLKNRVVVVVLIIIMPLTIIKIITLEGLTLALNQQYQLKYYGEFFTIMWVRPTPTCRFLLSGHSPEIGTFGRKWYLVTITYRVFEKLKKNNYSMYMYI